MQTLISGDLRYLEHLHTTSTLQDWHDAVCWLNVHRGAVHISTTKKLWGKKKRYYCTIKHITARRVCVACFAECLQNPSLPQLGARTTSQGVDVTCTHTPSGARVQKPLLRFGYILGTTVQGTPEQGAYHTDVYSSESKARDKAQQAELQKRATFGWAHANHGR